MITISGRVMAGRSFRAGLFFSIGNPWCCHIWVPPCTLIVWMP